MIHPLITTSKHRSCGCPAAHQLLLVLSSEAADGSSLALGWLVSVVLVNVGVLAALAATACSTHPASDQVRHNSSFLVAQCNPVQAVAMQHPEAGDHDTTPRGSTAYCSTAAGSTYCCATALCFASHHITVQYTTAQYSAIQRISMCTTVQLK